MLSLGIVGLPNVGKSTLFNALSKNNVLAANYPFATIEPNVGIVPLPDERLGKLAGLYNSEKIIPATVTFVDIAGLVRGASQGQGLGNQFLSNIRSSNAIVQVIRSFADPNVTHVDGTPDPARDLETINTELILADLQSLEKHLARADSDLKKDPKKYAGIKDLLLKAKALLDSGHILFGSGIDLDPLKEYQFLTAKPFIFVFNLDESDLTNTDLKQKLASLVTPAEPVFLCASMEQSLADLSDSEAKELLTAAGQPESGLDQLARVGFKALGLQTFLTAGPKESRAWTIHRGDTAPEAAGVIHTDFQKGFIKAEIVSYQDLMSAGSLPAARAAGKARLEGKDYVMQDGDVVEFRFNN
ncbi:MAG TPA: redox-regulated ATPase YchF [Puia sp.]|nr:redox-regulated ATPase YchF [Puia sp.]